jgi:hypothetical protein
MHRWQSLIGVSLLCWTFGSARTAVPEAKDPLGKPEYGFGLTPQQAGEGWISLFDGRTNFGWTGSRVEDGHLIGGQTTTEFGPGTILVDLVREGTIRTGDMKPRIRLKPGQFTLQVKGRGVVQLNDGAAVSRMILRPMNLQSISPGPDLSGWKRVDREALPEAKRPVWKVKAGVLEAVGGPGALEYQGKSYGDFVLQLDVRTRARHANGGVFVRSQPGSFMNGYEAQVYNRCEDNDPDKPVKYSSGAIDDRQLARRLVSRDFEFFRMTVIAHGPHLATWVNGAQMTDWTDTRAVHDNPRQGLRTQPGTIQLQAHDPDTDVEFRNIQVMEMP